MRYGVAHIQPKHNANTNMSNETQKNMDKVDIIRKHIGNDDFYDINGTSLLTKILSAMDEYAQQQVKNCSIPAVVGQSELFNCLGGDYAKGIKPCEEWCGEDMCQKPSN